MATDSYEESLLEFLITALFARVGEPGSLRGEGKSAQFHITKNLGGGHCAAGSSLPLPTSKGTPLSHLADIMVKTASGRLLVLDLKWAVSDLAPLKAYAYDMLLLKKAHGEKLRGVLVYLRPMGGGVPGEQAREVCFPYDQFFAIEHQDPQNPTAWVPILDQVEQMLTNWQR